ncbi:unnamed protein product [Fusarium venenatum]|uniref:Uncharacterized protein n=1 Tax=Fusarium venenatum TaxID=56646 RepID=A0A2L2SNN5_9HYPO|nr:uncharacterized protein FVRRES_11895 [Fusarium venenatum]CEI39204.1 unnamed protein product [Fusarium venenatum]
MPHLGPIDAFEDHIEVASTQRNATQRNTTGARDWETFSRVIHGSLPSWCSKDAGRSAMELGVSASSIKKKAIAHVDQPSIDRLI